MFINELFEKKSLRNSNPCWKGYHPVGTKKKNGKTVPNCVPTNENKYDDNLTITHRGNGYIVYHSFNRDAYTARGEGEYKNQIQPEWFWSAADAMEHAEMEIDGYNGDDEHQGIK